MVRISVLGVLAAALLPAVAGAQEGAVPACTAGTWVMVPGYADPGTIQGGESGACIVAMQTGDVEHLPVSVLTLAPAPTSPAPSGASTALAQPKLGAWACATASAPDVVQTISFTPADGYTTPDGQSGEWGAVDASMIEFQSGPYAGVLANVAADRLSFQPPGATEALNCLPPG